jgi:hypothetical protein
MNTITHVYLVFEILEDADERPVIHGVFTDLHMAMCVFNLSVRQQPGQKNYFSDEGDVARVEVANGPCKNRCWIVERVPLTTLPDMSVTEHRPRPAGYGAMSPAALDAWDKAGKL